MSRSMVEVDVVVVGFGAAGMSAAITAHDAGASVMVLEKMAEEWAGGNTRVSGQVWFSPDDIELAKVHLRDLSGDFPLPDDVVDAWANEMAGNTAWVTDRLRETAGRVTRDPADPYGQGELITKKSFAAEQAISMQDDRLPHYEWPEVRGNECGTDYHYVGPTQGYSRLWNTLKAAVELRGIDVRYETRAERLVQAADGTVVGVEVSTPDGPLSILASRGVVLAAGGFENDQQMVRDFLHLPDSIPWGSPGNTGDGIKMAQKAGAGLWHMDNFCAVPGISVELDGQRASFLTEPRGDGYVIVGNDGRRFIDETFGWRHGKAPINGIIDSYPGIPMHYVFDQRALEAGPLSVPYDLYAGSWAKVIHRYVWSEDNLAEVERGWIHRADSLEELATLLGVDPSGLESTIREYNAACEAGKDDALGRAVESLVPIDGPPYYGFSWGFVLLFTAGGPRKDGKARVLDPFGDPIPHLWAAGEISYTYSWRSTGGMGIGDGLAFGRIAGRGAAATAPVPGLVSETASR